MKIFLSSHGHLASGLKSSVEILLGTRDNITVFDAYVDESSVQEKLEEFFSTVEEGEQVVLCSDLVGGSVNTAMCQFLDRNHTMLVSGVNLAVLIDLALRDSITRKELEGVVKQCRELLQIVDLEKEPGEILQDDDFF